MKIIKFLVVSLKFYQTLLFSLLLCIARLLGNILPKMEAVVNNKMTGLTK